MHVLKRKLQTVLALSPMGIYNKAMDKKPKLTFALAGQLVSTQSQAKRILADAKKTYKDWLIPQAESVLRQLRALAQ